MLRSFAGANKVILENLLRNKEFGSYVFEYYDKLIIWIFGFSVAGISVTITNLSTFNNLFSESLVKTILFLFVTSILSGFLFKIFYLYFQFEYKKIENNLVFSLIYSTEIVEDILDDNSKLKSIYFYVKKLKENDIDSSDYLEFYDKADKDGRIEILRELDDIYNQLIAIQNTDFHNGMAYVKMIYKKNFGLSDKKINKLFENNNSVIAYKILSWTTFMLMFISCISFLSVIVILTINY